MSVKQFDKLCDQLLSSHNENKIFWKSQELDLLKSVAKLENHREQGTLFQNLQVLGRILIAYLKYLPNSFNFQKDFLGTYHAMVSYVSAYSCFNFNWI